MMRIVRELAAERNPVAKIAFLTRLPEAAVREALGLAAAAGAEVRGCLQPPAHPASPALAPSSRWMRGPRLHARVPAASLGPAGRRRRGSPPGRSRLKGPGRGSSFATGFDREGQQLDRRA